MIRILTGIFLLAATSFSYGQSFKKYAIGNSGCSVYSYCDPGKFEMTYSQDSAKVFTSECNIDNVYYGMICIELTEPTANIKEGEDVLVSYLDFLKSAFKVTEAAGYGKGHRLRGKEGTRGIIDYWKDGDKNQWKVKGWTDSKFIAVLYAYSLADLSETKVNAFLDGFLFKGM